ncbi:hypothetical protein U9M48_006192 [Paspalum notatum var. saurae]|uniref:Transcription repressor n=1 Tax=Paspalum notatum var. saurae TaxID=547442 RepID=A0AAQ3SJ70_PASNO
MLGCFSRLRRPTGSPAPEPMPAGSDDASTSAASTSAAGSTSPCSSSSSAHCKNGAGGAVAVGKNDDPSALSESGLSSAIASRRFFLSSPGRSNSIVDSSAHGGAALGQGQGVGVGAAGVAVPTYSPDPHADFLRSMEEMAAALRLDARRRGDRARLHELLLCYLALNDRRAHKYVVSAFTDLLLRLTAVAGLDDDDERHD